jgi:hypothetical protein
VLLWLIRPLSLYTEKAEREKSVPPFPFHPILSIYSCFLNRYYTAGGKVAAVVRAEKCPSASTTFPFPASRKQKNEKMPVRQQHLPFSGLKETKKREKCPYASRTFPFPANRIQITEKDVRQTADNLPFRLVGIRLI